MIVDEFIHDLGFRNSLSWWKQGITTINTELGIE